MSKWKIYVPDGVADILFESCYIKRELENVIRNTFRHRGFREVETAGLQFFDSYSGEEDIISQESMFKFFDKDGRILVLRPDLTVPVARLAATKFKNIRPLKISYIQNTYRDNQKKQFDLKEYTQAGVEIMGLPGPGADAEVIATAIDTLDKVGCKNFQIELGEVGFFKGLMEEAKLSKEDITIIGQLVDNKDIFGIEDMVNKHGIKGDLREAILSLPTAYGNMEIIDRMEALDINEASKQSLDNIRKIMSILDDYEMSKYVSIDLGILSHINYYTGTIFRGFTHSLGFPLLSGGRYDNLIGKFGVDTKATGFSLNINLLMEALERVTDLDYNKDKNDIIIAYELKHRKDAIKKSAELREAGHCVEFILSNMTYDDTITYGKSQLVKELYYFCNDGKVLHHIFDKEGK